ncbi:phage portal protein, HK97 family [Paucilactobacillus hokkaidonensis JCM 18461]|uniref:Phage portal protein, HK97 family n=2 Tax=Paucilactobacillus hokkaidonensis TaxID=1193095 RepID=A0A0A1GYH1_9LACO|nr:phage portal protein [Paucilactobacillus hokkaidonensis]BAP85521.1 phage portal protein, HK97 family [Paucilactobacillus hokkaidonensis JCM 18461]
MAIFENFMELFQKRQDASYMFDVDYLDDVGDKIYAKRMAVDKVINFIARAVSTTEFKFYNGTNDLKSPWDYKLNVRPNTDLSAANFWQEVVYKLIKDNEVLVIKNDTDDLLIADSFVRHESANFPDIFDGVTVKTYQFKRSFNMDEVWYMTYNNENLERYVSGLWGDYGRLLGRLIEINLRNNQIRGTVKANIAQGTQEQKQALLQKYVDKIFSSFKKNSVAIVPVTDGFEYNEVSGTAGEKNQSVDEISKLLAGFTDEVANILGVPPALVHGQNAEVDQNSKSFIQYCLKPLLNKIDDELNAKLFTQVEYESGKHVETVGLDRPSMFDVAEPIDKLISAGVANPNVILHELGLPKRPNGDEYVITKNYTTQSKGGDLDDNN